MLWYKSVPPLAAYMPDCKIAFLIGKYLSFNEVELVFSNVGSLHLETLSYCLSFLCSQNLITLPIFLLDELMSTMRNNL